MDDKRPVDNCPSIKMKVDVGEESGVINLSSVWESYNYVSSIETPKKEILKLSCPHCNSSIKGKLDCTFIRFKQSKDKQQHSENVAMLIKKLNYIFFIKNQRCIALL